MSTIKKHSYIKAFTVLELVLGLVISSLVIGMVYVIYDNISKQMIHYALQQDELMEYNQFQSLLSKDMALSKDMRLIDDSELNLSLPEQEVTYVFNKEYITRETTAIDTFRLKVTEVKFDSSDKITETYQALKVQTELLGQPLTIFEEKEVSLAKQINNFFLSEY